MANALHECLFFGAIIVDGQHKVAALAGETEQLLGLKAQPEERLALTVLPQALQEMVLEADSSGRPIARRTVEISTEGRAPVVVHATALPLPADQKKGGVALLLMNQTPRLDERLRHLVRLATAGTMAASLAHEIKNALVAGKTFIDLLLEKNQDLELVGVVRREMGRIDSLVTRMLHFERPATRTLGRVRLHEVLGHSLSLVQPRRKDKSIGLACSLQAAPDWMNGDDYELEQAFVNLFINALEAMGENGTLSVATTSVDAGSGSAPLPGWPDGPQLLVTIKDTGMGIPPKNMERLFEPFFTTKSGGTGLGLAITKRIIQDHRGAITAESQPNLGTTFQIRLPALNK